MQLGRAVGKKATRPTSIYYEESAAAPLASLQILRVKPDEVQRSQSRQTDA